MHEVGHVVLEHSEHCPLAEKEAGYFAGLALCPPDLLEHYGIEDAMTVAQMFNVSREFAENRLRTLHNRRGKQQNAAGRRFREYVVSRFRFKATYQMNLFANNANRIRSAV